MSNAKYRYAINEDGVTCCIDDVNIDNKNNHNFSCISCGKKLFPRLGRKNVHHFYHAKDCECSSETYIHKLAKLKLKEKFENSNKFLISFPITKVCTSEGCFFRKFECDNTKYNKECNLKDIYNQCECEKKVPNTNKTFIADLLLTNSDIPNRKALLIEIYNTHKCDEYKRLSNLKIIEIELHSEEELENFLKEDVIRIDGKNIREYNFNKNVNTELNVKIHRYSHIPGKGITEDLIDCRDHLKVMYEESDIEINVNKNICMYSSSSIKQAICSAFSIKECICCENYNGESYFEDLCKVRYDVSFLRKENPDDIDRCFKPNLKFYNYYLDLKPYIEFVKIHREETS